MNPEPTTPPAAPPPPPARAFTQGVGTVFQFVGVTFFLIMTFVCCGSSLLSKETASGQEMTRIGWHLPSDPPGRPTYSAQLAMTSSVFCGVLLGMALAGLGLGLQAQNRLAPWGAALVAGMGTIFWMIQTVFAARQMGSVVLTVIGALLSLLFGGLFALAVGAVRDMIRNPPPRGHELLPADYKIPYSHLHQDPPEVRLAKELEERRQRLAVQQKELEMLEEKIKRRM